MMTKTTNNKELISASAILANVLRGIRGFKWIFPLEFLFGRIPSEINLVQIIEDLQNKFLAGVGVGVGNSLG